MLPELFLYSSLFCSYSVIGAAAVTSPSTLSTTFQTEFQSWINSSIYHLLNLVISLLCFLFCPTGCVLSPSASFIFSMSICSVACKPMIYQFLLPYHFQPHFCHFFLLAAQVSLPSYHKTTFTPLFSTMILLPHSDSLDIFKIRTLLKLL